MYTNADCTLYLYSRNKQTECYTRVPVTEVYWEEVRQSSFLKTGQKNAVTALVVIPKESLDSPVKFTQGKDLIVKGIVTDEIDCTSSKAMAGSIETLKTEHDCLMVMTADERLYGSDEVQHYELSCR